jgi:4-amino-4-deoxy-L-arabinose transferase-like glycosyltransferase
MGPFLIGGLWFFVRFLRSRSRWLAWLAGLLWGVAFLYKYTTIVFPLCALVFLGLYLRLAERGRSPGPPHTFGRTSIILSCGFVTGLAPVLAYFAAHGALKDLVDATVRYNLEYTGALSIGTWRIAGAFGQATKWIMRNPFLYLTGIAGGVIVAIGARKNRAGAVWLFWLAAGWAAITLNRRYFHYHFIQMTAPLSILSACFLTSCIGWVKKRHWWILVAPALVACALLLASDVRKVGRALGPELELALGRTTQPVYWSRFVTGDFSFLADKYLAEYLEERTGQGDRICRQVPGRVP